MVAAFTRPLLATEHGEFDTGAETLAFAIARHCRLALTGVLPLVSNPEFEMVAPQLAAKADAEASLKRQHLDTLAQTQGVKLDLQVRRGPEAWQEIVDEARERDADLIVIRRRGKRGLLANLLVGEMVGKVVAHAPCSVLIAPRNARMWTQGVLVGVDPQAPDDGTLTLAARVAHDCGLPLHLLCVAAGGADSEAAVQALKAALTQARALHAHVDGEVQTGRAHQALIDAGLARGADLLVVGRHGGTALARAWIGGTAQKVIGLANCPVLVHVTKPQAKAATP
ncbi:MAG: universal stress protein [Rubrivivax sp.]|nr:universal stress protein [Rubrivivax sp.]